MPARQNRVFRFRVSLLDITPEIWREIEVPARYTFWDLHVAIQDAMGWLDCHFHSFMPVDFDLNRDLPIGIPGDLEDFPMVAGWTVPITSHFASPEDTLRYEYDLGDSWIHEVQLLEILPRKRGEKYPRCIAGERACPPEDCGGVSGYYQLLKILADPGHDEYEFIVDWLKGHAKDYYPYDPDAFDLESVYFSDPKKRWRIMMGDEEP